MGTKAKITAIGNEGFCVSTDSAIVYVDAFYHPVRGVAGVPCMCSEDVPKANLILVTHRHWDHFDPSGVADAASRTGAFVIGPASAILELRGRVPDSSLIALDPHQSDRRRGVPFADRDFPFGTVSAFRTDHGDGHNSYLVELQGFRFFHDGDNENTGILDIPSIGRLDALFIGPWYGSGWVEFIEKLAPRKYFLMHLTEEELADHEKGKFLPEICDRVPEGLVVLRPGQSYEFE
ncbi:MAG: MBL fold metallo-hydrolase [Planctomycetota bacterium]|nr:MBL fold metallo-hydrolase [Planctomycetota bacterium]